MRYVRVLVRGAASAALAFACSSRKERSSTENHETVGRAQERAASVASQVTISLSASDQAKYRHFMAGKKLTDEMSYQSADLDSAQVIDSVLITKALTLGGMGTNFEFVKIPNSERERAMVLAGDVAVAGTSQWDWWADENKESVYKSDVIVPNGAFEKGLYTTKDKVSASSIKSQKDVANYGCVSNNSWRVDWQTLSSLGFKSLQSASTTEAMFKMVEGGHADLTVQSFSGLPDMSITVSGVTLYPIEGWKVLLNGSRHFVVSKKHPNGAAIFEALQKGLASMSKSGEVTRALTESGFYNAKVKGWRVIQSH